MKRFLLLVIAISAVGAFAASTGGSIDETDDIDIVLSDMPLRPYGSGVPGDM